MYFSILVVLALVFFYFYQKQSQTSRLMSKKIDVQNFPAFVYLIKCKCVCLCSVGNCYKSVPTL